MFLSFCGKVSRNEGAAFVAPNATVQGDVILKPGSTVWYGAVLRGDDGTLTLGENSNVQDNAVLHCDVGGAVTLGRSVTVGHSAALLRGTDAHPFLDAADAPAVHRSGSYSAIGFQDSPATEKPHPYEFSISAKFSFCFYFITKLIYGCINVVDLKFLLQCFAEVLLQKFAPIKVIKIQQMRITIIASKELLTWFYLLF